MDGDRENGRGRPATLAEVFEPWEIAGESRRDSVPHRAGLLRALARCGVLAGGLSFPFILPGVVGLALGVLTGASARRDLDLISRGYMDHRGYHPTAKALSDARAAVVLSLLGPLLWLVVAGTFLTIMVIGIASK
jgi:hypothetical protein